MRTWPALEIRFPDSADLSDWVHAALLEFDITAIDEGTTDAAPIVWRVFFHDAESRDAAAARLHETFDRGGLHTTTVDVLDEDWAAKSQADIRAVRIGDVIVAPPWDVPELPRTKTQIPNPLLPYTAQVPRFEAEEGPVVIVIQPSMGFGTGHHATTRLCLSVLQKLNLHGGRVLDVGTGSGVLAIAASRLGANQVLGIDDDADAIEAARANLDLNPGAEVTLGVADIWKTTLRPVELVLANLTGELLVSIAPLLQQLSGAKLIVSGFTTDERGRVIAAFDRCVVDEIRQEDGWVCLLLTKEQGPT